jgi:hypothetical protein
VANSVLVSNRIFKHGKARKHKGFCDLTEGMAVKPSLWVLDVNDHRARRLLVTPGRAALDEVRSEPLPISPELER